MKAPPCLICGKPPDPEYRPFCSRHCADVDLQRWFAGRYVLSGDEAEDGDQPDGEGGESNE